MKNNCSAKDKGYVESIGKRRNENLKNCLNRKKTRFLNKLGVRIGTFAIQIKLIVTILNVINCKL